MRWQAKTPKPFASISKHKKNASLARKQESIEIKRRTYLTYL
jgi:hypothetical protein